MSNRLLACLFQIANSNVVLSMLLEYEDALRAAARLVSGVDQDVRKSLVRVKGREERYSEKFVTLLEERLGKFSDGGITWSVATHISDKQSGEETDTGSDMFISASIGYAGVSAPIQKGFQVQAKINKNTRFGISVDSPDRLAGQCEKMLKNSEQSYVFAYGEKSTSVLLARSVLDAKPKSLTNLSHQSVEEVFYDFFSCTVGDRKLFAANNEGLQKVVDSLRFDAGVRIVGKPTRRPKVRLLKAKNPS